MDVKIANVLQPYYVYLLISNNFLKKLKGRVYIGFTVDPIRRLKQHNDGVSKGGAFKTNNKGPWEMVLVVHGFPHEITALRFEWAWQNPHLSRKLKHVKKKKSNETHLSFHLRVLEVMLQTGPWKNLPLRVQWLNNSRFECIDHSSFLYDHSYVDEIQRKPLRKKNLALQEDNSKDTSQQSLCCICKVELVDKKCLICINEICNKYFHINCLANYFLGNENEDEVIPQTGNCPSCEYKLTWSHLILMLAQSLQ